MNVTFFVIEDKLVLSRSCWCGGAWKLFFLPPKRGVMFENHWHCKWRKLISATGHEGITWCSHVAVLKTRSTLREASISLCTRFVLWSGGWLCLAASHPGRRIHGHATVICLRLSSCLQRGWGLTVWTLLPSTRCPNGPNAAAGRRGRRRRWRSPSTRTPRASQGPPSQLTVVTLGRCRLCVAAGMWCSYAGIQSHIYQSSVMYYSLVIAVAGGV